MGQFQLAKAAAPPLKEGEAPEPTKEPTTVFDFSFREQSEGRFYLSDSKWLVGEKGGTVQFLAIDDAFVLSLTVEGRVTSWTALRRGAPRVRVAADGKRSMLQRWGWYILAAMLYVAYKAAQEKAASLAAGMAPGKKRK